MKISFSLQKISKMSLYLLMILTPLWFLPVTQNILDYQKQALLAVLVFLGIASWLSHAVSKRELTFRMSRLHIPVILFVGVAGISTYFSLWRYASFWGFPLDVTDSFMTIFAFSLLYLLIVNTVRGTEHLGRVLFALVASGGAASIFALLQLKGMFSFLPFALTKVATFNTIGNPNAVAVFAAVLLPLALALAFQKVSGRSAMFMRSVSWAVVLALFAVVALINFSDAWISLIVGLSVLLALGILNVKNRVEFGWASFVMVFVSLSLFLFVFNIAIPGAPAIPLEASPSQSATFNIAREVIGDSPIVGSGPGTFVLDYAQYHSSTLNQTIFWGTRFVSGASEFLDGIAERGIVGTLAYLGLLISALYLAIRNLLPLRTSTGKIGSFMSRINLVSSNSQGKDEASHNAELSDDNWMLYAGVFAAFASIVISQFLYPANFILWFLFWVLLGALGIFVTKSQTLKIFKITPTPGLALASSFAFLMFIIFGLGLLFIGGQKYIAEIRYRQALVFSAEGDLDGAVDKLLSAVNLNSSVDLYWRDLSQLYLLDVNRTSANTELSDEERTNKIQVSLANATTSAKQASAVAPANVANWNVQGFVYRNLIGIEGAENFAAEAYKKATELDPSSPFSWTELARVYITQASALSRADVGEEAQNEAYERAIENLNKAIELKEDYSSARYLLAVAYASQGKTEEAIEKLVEATVLAPRDIGLAFQLGVMYWQGDDTVLAQGEFERAKRVDPNYSNARYMLGLVYDRIGRDSEAKVEFEAVARLNPENSEVVTIIRNLEAGRGALDGITPSGPPIEETPLEIDADADIDVDIEQ